MSYRVDYNPEMKSRYPAFIKMKKRLSVRPLLIGILTIMACYCIYHYDLQCHLIPGDAAVTTAAFSGLIDNIDSGEPVRQAFFDFCKEIIRNGN